MPTNNSINTQYIASANDIKVGTNTLEIMTPAHFSTYMSDITLTGFVSWTGAGAYFDDTTLGSFSLLRGGTGYIKGKLVSFAGAQTVTGMTAGNTYWIYIDSAGALQKSSVFADSIFTDNIPLFECMRDSTPVTNNQVTVKENHPYNFPCTVSIYNHDVIGCIIENITNGANIALNGTQKIQINGADVLSDHGLDTTIPDSGGAAVNFYKYYTTAAGKWALYSTTSTFSGTWNSAGTPTALSAGRYAVYTLYCSKDNLNTTTPFYFAVLNTAQYSNLTTANNAISTGAVSAATNELARLEISQLGYIIFSQSSNSIVSVVISKATLKQTLSTTGTNTAALVNTNVTNFNGWLSSADTNVQAALETLDDMLKGGTAGQVLTSNGASIPTYRSEFSIQKIASTSSAYFAATTVIPFDDTIPQNAEGDEFLTVTITPTNASNILEIVFTTFGTNGTNRTIAALFRDATAGALAAVDLLTGISSGQFRHRVIAGSTAATTFKVRIGPSAAATVDMNGYVGSRLFGGVASSWLTVEELRV